MIPAYSPQARGRGERRFGTWQGRLPQELRLAGITTLEEANRFLRERYVAEMNGKFAVPAGQPGHAFVPVRGHDLERIFSVQTERTGGPRQHGGDRRAGVADRADALARDAGGVPGDHLRAPGRAGEHCVRAARGGALHGPRRATGTGRGGLAEAGKSRSSHVRAAEARRRPRGARRWPCPALRPERSALRAPQGSAPGKANGESKRQAIKNARIDQMSKT